jgi:hypothetical protein
MPGDEEKDEVKDEVKVTMRADGKKKTIRNEARK